MLVEDHPDVSIVAADYLEQSGCEVLLANSAEAAIDVLNKRHGIDLVLSDIVMPGMSGRELVEQIQQLWPGTRILCTSGYVWPAAQESERAYLPKPFTCQELLVKVKQVLSE